MFSKESAKEWGGQSLLDQPAQDRAAACLSGLPCQRYMIFHQASFGGSTEVPREITDSYCGPVASGEQYWAKKVGKVLGALFCLISLSCELCVMT